MRVWLATFILAAGCMGSDATLEDPVETETTDPAPGTPPSGDEPAGNETGGPTAGTNPPTIDPAPKEIPSSFTGTFNLLLQPDAEIATVGSTNCVLFWNTDGPDYAIQGGNATLTWDAGPNTETLRVTTIGAAPEESSGPGTSPVVLDYEALSIDHPWGVGFRADYSAADGTLPAGQEAALQLSFEYTGDLPEPNLGDCGGGGV